MLHDLVRIVDIDGHGAQRAADAARSGGVAHGLQDAVLGRDVEVVGKHPHRPGQDGQEHKIGAPQCLGSAAIGVDSERCLGVGMRKDRVPCVTFSSAAA